MPILTRDKSQFYKRVLICAGHPATSSEQMIAFWVSQKTSERDQWKVGLRALRGSAPAPVATWSRAPVPGKAQRSHPQVVQFSHIWWPGMALSGHRKSSPWAYRSVVHWAGLGAVTACLTEIQAVTHQLNNLEQVISPPLCLSLPSCKMGCQM